MQAALVEMPKFSFDVTMYGGDVSLVPGLEQWLTTFMQETVFRCGLRLLLDLMVRHHCLCCTPDI